MAGENLSESTRVVITISEWKRKIEAGEITPLNATNYKIVPDPDGEDYGVDTSVAERLTTMDLYNLVSKKANAANGEAGLRLETVFDNPITEVPIVGTGNVTVTSDSTGKILVASSGDSDSHTDDPDQIRTAMPMGLYKMSTSSHGHVHQVEAVTLGDGITMDNTNKIKHTNDIEPGIAQGSASATLGNGGSFQIPAVRYDAQGHIIDKGTTTMTLPTYSATNGIQITGGTLISHTNAINAGTAKGSDTFTAENGDSFDIPTVSYDAQGHVTGKGTTTVTLPEFAADDGIKIDTDGLTFKHTNAITAGTAEGTNTSTIANGGSFTTPTVSYDAQGHVTGKGTHTITLPTFAADDGVKIDTDGLTFKHTNNVTAGTASGTATSTIGNGGSFSIPTVTYDKHGHITGKGTTTITTPTFGAGDGIKLDGLNFKHTNAITAGTAEGTATSTLGNGGNFEIPTITYDAQGHITDKGTTKITLPTYTGSDGVTVSGTSITNSGVRSIATGTANGTISVNTNGTATDVAVKGLGSSAYMNTTDTYSSTGTTPTSGKAVAQAIGTVTALMGSNNGIATLDASGKIPSSQIPGSYDDVLNFDTVDDFPDVGEEGKIYVAKATNTQYRWGGESYIPIGSHLALGETSSTAYRGDRGAVAYTHATDSARNTTAKYEALYAIGITAHGHVGSSTAITAGTGISLASNKISHTNSITAGTASGSATATIDNGGSFSIPTISYDAQGHVTGKGTTTITIPTYAANTGIKLNGLTFQHTNSVTAGTASGSATATIGNGGSFSIPTVSYDAQGHVTGKGTTTITIPTFAADSGIKIADDGLTFQHTNAITAGTASGSATKTLTFGDTFTIPTVSYDAQGHVTGKGTTTMTMPSLGTSATTAAYGNHTHATSIAASSGTNQLNLAASTKYAITAGGTSYVFTTPADTHWTSHLYVGASDGSVNVATTNGNTYLIICDNSTVRDRRKIAGAGGTTVTSDADGNITITSPALGTGASNAAYGNHTHGITLAADSGTSAITLNPSTKYKLTAGGQSIIFTTPVNSTYTVNDGTLTIQGNGTSLGTFTANQAGASTINITPANIGAATSGHTHGIALATDSGTSAITLSPSTKYKLTAGGQSIIFTTPTDHTYTVNNGTLTIQGNGTSLGTFTANQAGNSTINITPANIGAAAASHGNHVPTTQTANNAIFLRNDNTWATVTPANIGAAAASHGNHVPATQTANNAIFLRNDNTWQTVTPANIGAATASHTHSYAGSASVGGPATNVAGTYSGNGGQLTPSAIANATVRFVMMNNPKGLTGFPTYADCLLMDTYSGSDVPWSTGLGIIKQDAAPRMFLFNGAKGNTTTWKNINEVLTTSNYNSYAAAKSHTHTISQITDLPTIAETATGSTIVKRNSSGYIFATYLNQSSSAETPTTSSYIIYANSDGYLRKSSLANIKSILGLGSAAYTNSTAYAAASHGNHVPATQTANNAIFLRNDNTWQTVTPANIGAAAASHTHSGYASSSHTHTTSLASGGTATVNLAANTAYTLTAGGTSVVFKTPAASNTTYSVATGDSNGQIKVTPSSGSAYNVSVKGLGSAAYTASTSYAASSHDHHSTSYGTQALRHLASGTAAATTTNCPSGAWYGYHS